MKRVAILLATYNGERWLDEQLDSLFAQEQVDVTVFASDDGSSDTTLALLQARADARLICLPSAVRCGSAAGNFFRLLRDVDFSGYDAVALSDQDDIWHAGKLARALRLMQTQAVDAVSGNVEAFWPDGRRLLLDKSQPQQIWDHHFEAAGPGCTYVLSNRLARALQDVLRARRDEAGGVALHDWFIYCYARSKGWRWHIDEQPGMDYRQHAGNVIGANEGSAAARARLDKILSGWYRKQILLIARLCDCEQQSPAQWLTQLRLRDLLQLLIRVRQMRRHRRDSLFLGIFFLIMYFRKGWVR